MYGPEITILSDPDAPVIPTAPGLLIAGTLTIADRHAFQPLMDAFTTGESVTLFGQLVRVQELTFTEENATRVARVKVTQPAPMQVGRWQPGRC